MRAVLVAMILSALVSSVASAGPIVPVRPLYLVPADRTPNAEYAAAIDGALLNLQNWFTGELGGLTFDIAGTVGILSTMHTASYYSTTPHPFPGTTFDFFFNVLDDATALGVVLNDPSARWVVYIDADPAPGQSGGAATAGITIIGAPDLRGLVGLEPAPPSRWVGGLGHEMGHTFGLPHPLDCLAPNPAAGCPYGALNYSPNFVGSALMQFGYLTYPATYFLPEERQFLATTSYIGVVTVPEPGTLTFTLVGVLVIGGYCRRRSYLGPPDRRNSEAVSFGALRSPNRTLSAKERILGISAALVDVLKQPLQPRQSIRRGLANRLAQKLAIGAGFDDRFHVSQILRTTCEQFHDDYRVDRRNGNAFALMGAVQTVLDDTQSLGQGHLIDIDTVELDDGNAHSDEAAGVFFEGFVSDQKIDVRRRTRAIAIGIGAKRANQGMANSCF
jgi:hypothetical protein